MTSLKYYFKIVQRSTKFSIGIFSKPASTHIPTPQNVPYFLKSIYRQSLFTFLSKTTIVLFSVSIDLSFLEILYKSNYTTKLCILLSMLSVMFLWFIQVAAYVSSSFVIIDEYVPV